MIETYGHHITKSIRSLYKKRLKAPIIYLIFLVFIWLYFGVFSVLFPLKISDTDSLEALYQEHDSYVHTALENLSGQSYNRILLLYHAKWRLPDCTALSFYLRRRSSTNSED